MENVTANIQSLTGNLALDTIVSGLITLVVCYIAIRIIKAVVAKALGKAAKLDLPVKNLITKAVTFVLYAVAIIIVAGAFGINSASLVALLSVVGLALSMSVQGLLGQFSPALGMSREEVEGTLPEVDYVAGVPDSGLPHGLGFAMQTGQTFARPFVKYTPTWPRSFMPTNQAIRNRVAKMKQIPVPELIDGKRLLLVDDSIVRGTQLRETVDFLYNTGAREVHMRSACPPIIYGCKYLSFSRSNSDYELIARRKIKELEPDGGEDHIAEYADDTTERGRCLLRSICEEMGFDSLRYQSLDGLLEAIGLDRDRVCTYCWDGRE